MLPQALAGSEDHRVGGFCYRRTVRDRPHNGHMNSDERRIFRVGVEGVNVVSLPEASFSRAVAQWNAAPEAGPAAVIDAARHALGAGLDSPALRVLADMSGDSRRDEVDAVVRDALDELQIPHVADLRQGLQIAPGGGVERRPATDRIRFWVRPVPEDVGGFELQVYVNDTEMTSVGAGMGMDPYEVLVPENRLVATEASTRIPIARCHLQGIAIRR